jgi:site-specific recombinase XerD
VRGTTELKLLYLSQESPHFQWIAGFLVSARGFLYHRPFIKHTDLPHISLHSLRHTNATLLISAGVDMKTVSSRLGHARLSTTSDIYTHAIKSGNEKAAGTLSQALS